MVTVDWANTKVIYVPKSYMTQIQTVPYEIMRLDVNTFRKTLRDLEDDVDGGRMWPWTHEHSDERTLSGTLYGREVKILSPYTITFENGSYAVEIYGGDSNILDVVNLNNVSVRQLVSRGTVVTENSEMVTVEAKIDALQADVDQLNLDLQEVKDQAELGATRSIS